MPSWNDVKMDDRTDYDLEDARSSPQQDVRCTRLRVESKRWTGFLMRRSKRLIPRSNRDLDVGTHRVY